MEQIIVTHGFVKKLASNIRSRYGRDVRHTEIIELVADALGSKAGPLMHALKHVSRGDLKQRESGKIAVDLPRLPLGLVQCASNPDDEFPKGMLAPDLMHFLKEQAETERYLAAGLTPRNRGLLHVRSIPSAGLMNFVGRYLARPLYAVRPDLMSSVPSEAADNIRHIFEFAAKAPCVLWIDQLELLGRDRDGLDDAAGRLVSALLVALDDVPSHVVVIATSVNLGMLDRAMLRRFEMRTHVMRKEPAARWHPDRSCEGLTEFQRGRLALAHDGDERVLFVVQGYGRHPDVSSARLHLRRRGIAWHREEPCDLDFVDAINARSYSQGR